MIASCPSCGTHYKHEPPKTRVRARCGRCDAELDLTRHSPYRIVSSVSVTAVRAAAPSRPRDLWQEEDPLPQIPEMTPVGAFESSLPPSADSVMLHGDEHAPSAPATRAGGLATFGLWVAAGAIAGTGASWTMGGATVTGVATGMALGAVAGWGWLRWTSPK